MVWRDSIKNLGRTEVSPPHEVSQIQEQLYQAPPGESLAPNRWSLKGLRQHCTLLKEYSLSGIWRLLQRSALRYKRGRAYLHSPDPGYATKRDYALLCVQQALCRPEAVVALYLDEMSYHRQPSLTQAWELQGSQIQPLAVCSHKSNTQQRVIGTLDVATGKVVHDQAPKIGVKRLVAFYQKIRQAYPQQTTIYVIQDNWPVHFHPKVLEAATQARVTIVTLPTYAPWLNPIEKLWRWLRQQVLHLHRLSDAWDVLKQRVHDFLSQFQQGALTLLRYVGLLPGYIPD